MLDVWPSLPDTLPFWSGKIRYGLFVWAERIDQWFYMKWLISVTTQQESFVSEFLLYDLIILMSWVFSSLDHAPPVVNHMTITKRHEYFRLLPPYKHLQILLSNPCIWMLLNQIETMCNDKWLGKNIPSIDLWHIHVCLNHRIAKLPTI